jgi:hypothetical protein
MGATLVSHEAGCPLSGHSVTAWEELPALCDSLFRMGLECRIDLSKDREMLTPGKLPMVRATDGTLMSFSVGFVGGLYTLHLAVSRYPELRANEALLVAWLFAVRAGLPLVRLMRGSTDWIYHMTWLLTPEQFAQLLREGSLEEETREDEAGSAEPA